MCVYACCVYVKEKRMGDMLDMAEMITDGHFYALHIPSKVAVLLTCMP